MRSLVITVYSVPEKCHHLDCQVLNNSSIHFYFPAQRRRVLDTRGGWGSTPYDALYEIYERVGISPVEVYKRVGTSVIWALERAQRANR